MEDFIFPDYSRNHCAIASEILKHFDVHYGQSSLDILKQDKKKIALVLLDGLGWNVFSNLNNAKSLRAIKTTSVFPSTTATVLMSMSTGLAPGEHAVIGYKSFFKEAGSIIKPLDSTYASSHRRDQLREVGTMKEMFNVTTIFDRLNRKHVRSTVITPEFLIGSEYSNMIHSGASETLGYDNIWDALYLYKRALENSRSRFVFFYAPYIDTLSHSYGHGHEAVKDSAEYILGNLAKITKEHRDKVTGIITADHGQTDITKEIDLHRDRSLMRKLELPPYGDGRAPLFRARNDIRKDLSKYELRVFSKSESKPLFGRIDGRVADQLPDFVGVSTGYKSYGYRYEIKPKKRTYTLKSNHGGLSKDEMEIPLIILD